ncbi:hypothetical protein KIPB_011588, partial [Kipferlia bialata]
FTYSALLILHIVSRAKGERERALMESGEVRQAVASALRYMILCHNEGEGGFALYPGGESHGGATFCAVSALTLFGARRSPLVAGEGEGDALCSECTDVLETPSLVRWLTARQRTGFAGRPNKQTCSCYGFWVYGALACLGKGDLCDTEMLRLFCLNTQYAWEQPVPIPETLRMTLAHASAKTTKNAQALAKGIAATAAAGGDTGMLQMQAAILAKVSAALSSLAGVETMEIGG